MNDQEIKIVTDGITLKEVFKGQKALLDLLQINTVVEKSMDESILCNFGIKRMKMLADYFNLGALKDISGQWFFILDALHQHIETNQGLRELRETMDKTSGNFFNENGSIDMENPQIVEFQKYIAAPVNLSLIPKNGDLMRIGCFEHQCNRGDITDYTGVGYYSDGVDMTE